MIFIYQKYSMTSLYCHQIQFTHHCCPDGYTTTLIFLIYLFIKNLK